MISRGMCGGGLLLPQDVPGLSAWDMDNPNNNINSVPPNGSLLASINTICATGENFAQASAPLQFTYVTNACGAHGALQALGAQTMLSAPAKAYATNGAMTIGALINFSALGAAAQVFISRSGLAQGWKFGQITSGLGYFGSVNKHSYFTSLPIYSLNTWQAVRAEFNGTNNVKFYINSQLMESVTAISGTGANAITTGLSLGALTNNANFFTGMAQYFYAYPGILPADLARQFDQYLMQRIPA